MLHRGLCTQLAILKESKIDHSTHTRLPQAELTADTLEGATIYGIDDETIGTVSHLHGSGAGDVHALTSWTKDELRQMPEHTD